MQGEIPVSGSKCVRSEIAADTYTLVLTDALRQPFQSRADQQVRHLSLVRTSSEFGEFARQGADYFVSKPSEDSPQVAAASTPWH